MAVRQVPCRHKDAGGEVEIPATALRYFPDYEPVEAEDRKRYGYDKPDSDGQPDDQHGGEATPAGESTIPSATTSKPATGAAKKNKE